MKLIYNNMSRRTYFLLLSLAIFLLIGSAFFSYKNFKDYKYYDTRVTRAENAKLKIQKTGLLVKDLKITSIKVLAAKNPTDIVVYNNQVSMLEIQKKKLEKAISDNPAQVENLKNLVRHIKVYTYLSDSLIEDGSMTKIGIDVLYDHINSKSFTNDSVTIIIDNMMEEEVNLLEVRRNKKDNSEFFTPASFLFSTILSVIIVVILFLKITGLLNQSTEINQLFKGVLDSSPNGIINLKSIRNKLGEIEDFSINIVNEQSLTLLKQKSIKVSGNTLTTTFPYLMDDSLSTIYKSVIDDEQTVSDHTLYLRSSASHAFWCRLILKKLDDGLVITFSDITEEKNKQREIDLSNLELKKSNEELEQFAYVASHDLQEPLRKVRAFGDRLATKYSHTLDETGQDYIMRMQNAAARMQKLIDDLLQYSRISRNKKAFEKIDLNTVIKEITEDLSESIEEKKARVNYENLPTIKGDFFQLKQLFQNLISNSIKFSKAETAPEITISFKPIKAKNTNLKNPMYNNYWQITVKDNGIGFDSQYKDKIFTIFQRLHGRHEYKGTGIGLAICDRIAENHFGKIEAESNLGSGAVFTILFPKFKLNESYNNING